MYEEMTEDEIEKFENDFRNARIGYCVFGIIIGLLLLVLLWA